jgi:hypothetical protein
MMTTVGATAPDAAFCAVSGVATDAARATMKAERRMGGGVDVR